MTNNDTTWMGVHPPHPNGAPNAPGAHPMVVPFRFELAQGGFVTGKPSGTDQYGRTMWHVSLEPKLEIGSRDV